MFSFFHYQTDKVIDEDFSTLKTFKVYEKNLQEKKLNVSDSFGQVMQKLREKGIFSPHKAPCFTPEAQDNSCYSSTWHNENLLYCTYQALFWCMLLKKSLHHFFADTDGILKKQQPRKDPAFVTEYNN